MIYIVTYGVGSIIKGVFLSEENANSCRERLERGHPHDYFFVRGVESDIINSSKAFLEEMERNRKCQVK